MKGREGTVADPLTGHFEMLAAELSAGRVVPFLGAGVNLCGRAAGQSWVPGRYLPSGNELAEHLAEGFRYPLPSHDDLARVAEYAAVMSGSGPLYEELRKVFDADYPPTPVHSFLASMPVLLSRDPSSPLHLLFVSTNYDDSLERALLAAGERFDLVSYIAEGEHRGRFVHQPWGRAPVVIDVPNEYRGLSLDSGSIVLKLHGAVDRADAERDSYVITEDDYIEYLTRTDISSFIPVTLAAKLRRSHFLFLGYRLRDWNLRVILHRLWGGQRLTYRSWAVLVDADPVEEEYWVRRNVDLVDVPLEEYVAHLSDHVRAIGAAKGA
jgi:hypothetical protein